VIVVLLVEDVVPFSFLLMALASAVTSTSAAAPSASVAAPLVPVWWTRRAQGLVLRLALQIRIFLNVLAV
jgi:hypothetical protein